MAKTDELEHFYAPDRTTWRAWLAANHATATGVWLIYFKKESGKTRVNYDEAVEEALCFGWIDSVPNKIDDDSYKQLFSPRKPKSNWSALNKTRVERLVTEGVMQPSGLAKVEWAKQTGTWDALNDVEQALVPDDLAAAFAENPPAADNWNAFSNSTRKGILQWLLTAKTAETRARRIAETATLAAQNLKANQYVRK